MWNNKKNEVKKILKTMKNEIKKDEEELENESLK